MNDSFTSLKRATWVACLVVGISIGESVQQAALADCNPTVMIQKVLKEDLKNALDEAKLCVANRKAVEATESPLAGLNTAKISQVVTLGYYQLAQAQLEAALGDFRSAGIHVSDAEATAKKWSDFYQPPSIAVSDWDGLLAATRGFLLEKSGDIAGAKQLYSGNVSANENLHLYGDIRLAELALDEENADDALRIAHRMQVSHPDGPHSWIVFGALAEKRRDFATAITDYKEALKRCENIRSQFFPIYYFGCSRVREAIVRLGDR